MLIEEEHCRQKYRKVGHTVLVVHIIGLDNALCLCQVILHHLQIDTVWKPIVMEFLLFYQSSCSVGCTHDYQQGTILRKHRTSLMQFHSILTMTSTI